MSGEMRKREPAPSRVSGDVRRYGRLLRLDFEVPAGVLSVLRALWEAGYEAVLVGGCVRDALRGTAPDDFDVASQATPDQVADVLRPLGHAVIPTGLKHGTVTVPLAGDKVEITTYRVDGEYLDQRHCDVRFTRSLVEDLARRDFTINAMAVVPVGEGKFLLVDPFDGEDDLQRGVVRCVGVPEERFAEDPLRILRAVRFAARFGFEVEGATHEALLRALPDVDTVSRERKTAELLKTLAAPHAQEALLAYAPAVFQVLPELRALGGFDQHSPWHDYDAWAHTARVVGALERRDDDALLMAALLHDCAKPETFELGEDGRGHFPGHDVLGARRAREIMGRRLRLPGAVAGRATLLVRFHELRSYSERALTRLARQIGEHVRDTDEVFDVLGELLVLRKADIRGQREDAHTPERLAEVDAGLAALDRLRAGRASIHVRDLAIGGAEVMALGVPQGPEVGRVLSRLLDLVVAGEVPNGRRALERAASELL